MSRSWCGHIWWSWCQSSSHRCSPPGDLHNDDDAEDDANRVWADCRTQEETMTGGQFRYLALGFLHFWSWCSVTSHSFISRSLIPDEGQQLLLSSELTLSLLDSSFHGQTCTELSTVHGQHWAVEAALPQTAEEEEEEVYYYILIVYYWLSSFFRPNVLKFHLLSVTGLSSVMTRVTLCCSLVVKLSWSWNWTLLFWRKTDTKTFPLTV